MENSVATLGVQQHWILMHHLNFFYLLNFRNILLLKCLGQGDIFLKRAVKVIAMLILASWEMDSQISEKENLKKSRSLFGFAFFFSFYLFQIKEKYE